ncbi:hypothetical protein ABZ714_11275 [Streptomyces sp. NPDC006798]|uniref:hypothetical protein n=1 Tax=Streptomyces sp. NPDC006798 TaxID=3155462 RepID=UPI0033E38157
MSHPDFELYDNVGRTGEQTAAARSGIATPDDLLRWARRDAEPFLGEHSVPEGPLPSPDLAPYLKALTAAATPAEAHAVTDQFLDAAEPVLRAVSDYLVAAAKRNGRYLDAAPGSPPRLLMEAASRSLSIMHIADEASMATLRAHYDPAPAPAAPNREQSPPGLPPAPPSPRPGR